MKPRFAFALTLLLIAVPAAVTVLDVVTYARANRSTNTIMSRGEQREYSLHVPASYDRSRPTPLVISIHGGAMWPKAQEDASHWDRVADREGFIVAYSSGRTGRGPRSYSEDDVPYFADLIDEIERHYNIDRARIFANGLSNGGGMSFILSCTMRDRIAAVGLVGAAHLLPFSWCGDQRPFPMISFHGTGDTAAPYSGGKSWVVKDPLPSIPEVTNAWARRNQCAAAPVESRVADDVTKTEYVDCAENAPAILYTIHGGGHTWPGGGYMPEWFVGKTTGSIDASSLMWEFFSQHPLRM